MVILIMLYKNTLIKIKKSFGRYISLVIIVLVGVGFYAGVYITSPNILNDADRYYKDHQLMDFKIVSTMGLTDNDVRALSQIEGVTDVIPSYSLDVNSNSGNAIRVHAIEDNVNTIKLIEGQMPRMDTQCVADARDYSIGDVVVITDDVEDKLKNTEFTVTGLANSVLYLDDDYGNTTIGNGKLSSYIFINKANFILEAYTEIYLVSDTNNSVSYSKEYKTLATKVNDYIVGIKTDRENARYNEILDEANEIIAENETELNDERLKAEKEFSDAMIELKDGERELRDGKETAAKEFADALVELEDGERELRDGKRTAAKEFADALIELEDGSRELQEGKETAAKEFADALAELEDGERELRDGKETGIKEFADALVKLEDGSRELEEGKETAAKEFADALVKLEDGSRELQEGKEMAKLEFADARETLIKGSQELQAGKELGIKEFASAKETLDYNALLLQYGMDELAKNEEELERTIVETNAGFDTAKQGIAYGWAEINGALEAAGITANEIGPAIDALDAALASMIPMLDFLPPGSDNHTALLALIAEYTEKSEGLKLLKTSIDTLSEQETQLNEGIAAFNAEIEIAKRMMESAKSEIADNEKKLNGGYAEYYDNFAKFNTEIAENEKKLEAGYGEYFANYDMFRDKMAKGEKELEDGYAEYYKNLAKFNTEIADSEKELEDGYAEYYENLIKFETEIAENEIKLSDGYKEYYENLAEVENEIAENEKKLEDGYAEYYENLAKFDSEIAKNEKKLKDGYEEYYVNLAEFDEEIAENEAKLIDGYAEYYDNLAKFNTEIADAEQKISDAKAELADIEQPKWYIFNRSAAAGYDALESCINIVSTVAAILPIFFIALSMLMTSNSMSRMIAEERNELGTLASLGYNDNSIVSTYLMYVLSASVLGAISGFFIGCRFIPPLIYSNFIFALPPLIYEYNMVVFAIISAVTISLMIIVTVVACNRELKQTPAYLMRPLPPKHGQKIFLEKIALMWRYLSFTWKVTMRNIFRYKKRAFMTIIGVAGSTTLLLIAFGLRDGMDGIAQKQFGDIMRYTNMIILKDDTTSIRGELRDLFEEEQIERPLLIKQSAFSCEMDGQSLDAYLVVPQNNGLFNEYFNLEAKSDNSKIDINNGGIIITQRIAKVYKLRKGDVISIKDADNNSYSMAVTDIAVNYASNYIYMNATAYDKIFSGTVSFNAVVSDSGGSETGMAERLLDSELVSGVVFTNDSIVTVAESTERLNGVIVLIIIVASILAIVVLYNLTAINISERTREIATLKVLGFRDGETNAYIYREAIILTIISIGVGIAAGVLLHHYVVDLIEAGALSLLKRIQWPSFILSCVLTLVFSFFMQIATYFKLKKIDMVESLKSVE